MDPGGHMDGFLEACGDLSFSALVEKDEEIGSSSPPKAKKRKKDKKEKKGKKTSKVEKELAGDKDQELMADKASKLPAEEDPDETWPEHLPRPPPLDPYYLLGVPEEAPSHEDEEKPSKRAMQRALQGFSRKSGGWKHKKRGSGKSPLGKGRGKNCRYCANSFHQVTVVFLEFSAGFVIMSSFAAGMFLKTWFGFFASPRCRAMSDDPRRGAEGPGRSRANEKGSGLERPPEPSRPPRGMGLYSAGPKASMGHPASPGPVATAPRYSGSRHGPDETDDQEKKKKTKKRRRSRSRSRGRDRRRRGAEQRRAEKAMPAERPTLPGFHRRPSRRR